MRARLAPRLLAALLSTAAAAGAAPVADETPTPREFQAVEQLARGADVLGIGEAHDNPAHHAIQALVLDRLVAAGARPVLAFEMLTEEQQPAVDQALGQPWPAAELARRLAWHARGWPDFTMYYPLFQAARRFELPVLAADLDPATRRAISRRGLDALPAPERARLASRLAADSAREDALRREIKAVHCGLLPAAAEGRMTEAWHARNVTMARRIAGALSEGRKVVVIAGRAHLGADAVPGQLAALRPGTRVAVVDLVERPDGTPLPNADLVLATPGVSRPDECTELRRQPPKWN